MINGCYLFVQCLDARIDRGCRVIQRRFWHGRTFRLTKKSIHVLSTHTGPRFGEVRGKNRKKNLEKRSYIRHIYIEEMIHPRESVTRKMAPSLKVLNDGCLKRTATEQNKLGSRSLLVTHEITESVVCVCVIMAMSHYFSKEKISNHSFVLFAMVMFSDICTKNNENCLDRGERSEALQWIGIGTNCCSLVNCRIAALGGEDSTS